ncbi:hypothetical protein JTB14_031577 [Gonioctena quinquepunctata]|nr:hypothetical protein JTB14_031577 [Gonioctena quinquepunctata]
MKQNKPWQVFTVTYKTHCLKLNSGKTKAILSATSSNMDTFPQYCDDEIIINHVLLVKNLSLWMDQDLKYSYHLSIGYEEAYASLKTIFHDGPVFCQQTKSMLYDSLVL